METIQKMLLPENKAMDFVAAVATMNLNPILTYSVEDFFAERKIVIYCGVPENSFDEFNTQFGKYLKK